MNRTNLFEVHGYASSILGSGLLVYSVLFPVWLIVNAWLPLTGLRIYLSWLVWPRPFARCKSRGPIALV